MSQETELFTNNDLFTRYNELINKSKGTEDAIGRFLREFVDIYDADKARIFEIDNDLVRKTYEACKEGLESDKYFIDSAPRYVSNVWLEMFGSDGRATAETHEFFKDKDEMVYETLSMLGVDAFIATPLSDFESIFAYVVVENPHRLKEETYPISLGGVFLKAELVRRNSDAQKQREKMSFRLLERAITSNAYGYFKVNLTKNEVLPPIIEVKDNQRLDYSYKFGDPLPTYDEIIRIAAETYVAEEYREGYKNCLSSEYLKDQYSKGETMPEYTCRINSSKFGWHYRKYVIYMSEDLNTGDIFALEVVYDISEQMKAKQLQEEQHKELEKALNAARIANEAKTKFMFNMSHDVRTPLNAVMGFVGMAKRNMGDAERVLDCLNKMETSGRQLVNIINDVLKISRIESGQQDIVTKPISIGVGATELEIVFMPAMEEKHIFFETGARNIRDLYVYADQQHINQVIFNVMSNAIKYTPEGGKIIYSFEQLEDLEDGRGVYRWTVKDNGIGMSEEFLEHIYERFSRERSTTESGIEGTGLGMSLVHELVELMGGTIDVKSKKGEGTTVSFDIPLVKTTIEEVMEQENETNRNETNVSLTGKRALLVEDNAMNREIAIDLLNLLGMESDEAEDGDIAVEKLREKGPDYYDVVLMDIQMPRMDGYTATKEIRKMYPENDLTIIGLSANAFDENKKMSLEAGMDDHMGKPINAITLKRVLCTYLK